MRDAVAVMQLLMYLEKAVPEGKESELSAAKYVNERRRWAAIVQCEDGGKRQQPKSVVLKPMNEKHPCSNQKDSRGPSFATISASGPNAALAHYKYSAITFSLFLTGFWHVGSVFGIAQTYMYVHLCLYVYIYYQENIAFSSLLVFAAQPTTQTGNWQLMRCFWSILVASICE